MASLRSSFKLSADALVRIRERNSLMGKNEYVCALTRLAYQAKAYFAAEKWARGLYGHLAPEDELLMLKAVLLCAEL